MKLNLKEEREVMKFDVAIPGWAKWVSQDGNGAWYAHEKKPFYVENIGQGRWWPNLFEIAHDAFICQGECPKDSSKELYEIKWKKENKYIGSSFQGFYEDDVEDILINKNRFKELVEIERGVFILRKRVEQLIEELKNYRLEKST